VAVRCQILKPLFAYKFIYKSTVFYKNVYRTRTCPASCLAVRRYLARALRLVPLAVCSLVAITLRAVITWDWIRHRLLWTNLEKNRLVRIFVLTLADAILQVSDYQRFGGNVIRTPWPSRCERNAISSRVLMFRSFSLAPLLSQRPIM
jgi:hypothetical protein